MVSSTLSVDGFLYTIEQLFRARNALGGIEVDAEVLNSLLEVIMTIKFDRIFEGIHDKCRILFNNLIPSIAYADGTTEANTDADAETKPRILYLIDADAEAPNLRCLTA